MRPIASLLAVLGATLVSAESRTASVFVQPVTSPEETVPASPLAEIAYESTDPSAGPEVTSYEAPELPEGTSLVRVGIYDEAASAWLSSTSVASTDNFDKGYSPHITISVDAKGNYLGVALRGVRIDAGQTRDFGPQARLVVTAPGKQPDLNKPVVLSPEGKKVEPEEKTFLQKCVTSVRYVCFYILACFGPMI